MVRYGGALARCKKMQQSNFNRFSPRVAAPGDSTGKVVLSAPKTEGVRAGHA